MMTGLEKDEETMSWSVLVGMDRFDFCFEIKCPINRKAFVYNRVTDIEYFHELQNLFYWVTKFELEINQCYETKESNQEG